MHSKRWPNTDNMHISHSIGPSPYRQAYSRLVTQWSPRLLENPNVHYRVHNSLPLHTALSKMNPILILTLFKIIFSIALKSSLTSSKCITKFKFHNQNSIFISFVTHTLKLSHL
jgi:hypothetical protein